ncbi:hypothetical protein MPRS_48740 [Mycobacterium paraseoulense]|nr:hypothetical protein MPRS_48740 [Mycobacterium paraseoulense]
MHIGGALGVEAVGSGGSTHARGDLRTGSQVKAPQSQSSGRLTATVDAVPNPVQRTIFQVCFQLSPGEESQCLSRGDHSALDIEQAAEL